MSIRRQRGSYASEQSPGAVSPELPQQDRVRVETVRTDVGQDLILAVVADGEGHPQAGESAEMVVAQLFEGVTRSGDRDLNSVLRGQLEDSGRFLMDASMSGEGLGEVALTAIAIRRDRLYYAHVGHTMAILVREGRAIPLTGVGDQLLGASYPPVIQTGDPRGMALNPGDSVVLASDGLTRISPEDGKPFVHPEDIADYVEGNTPLEAARHLLSIAMGRDVDDNVSVVVVQLPGGRARGGRGPVTISAAIVGVLLVFALGVAGINWLREIRIPPPPVDYGYAVLIHGSVRVDKAVEGESIGMVSNLGTIPAGATLTALDESRLALQTTYEDSFDLSATSFYLTGGSRVRLTILDPHPETSSGDQHTLVTGTVLELISGRLLVVRGEGDREIQVTVEGKTISLIGFGAGVMGFIAEDGTYAVDCLLGRCLVSVVHGDPIELMGGQRLPLVEAKQEDVEVISEGILQGWDKLCGLCLSEP